MDHDDVHNGIYIDSLEDGEFSWTELPEELHDECFGLGIIEDGLVVLLVKNELEGRVVDEFFNFVNQLLGFGVINLETEF